MSGASALWFLTFWGLSSSTSSSQTLAHLPWVPEQETLAQSQKEFDQVPGTLGFSPGLVV